MHRIKVDFLGFFSSVNSSIGNTTVIALSFYKKASGGSTSWLCPLNKIQQTFDLYLAMSCGVLAHIQYIRKLLFFLDTSNPKVTVCCTLFLSVSLVIPQTATFLIVKRSCVGADVCSAAGGETQKSEIRKSWHKETDSVSEAYNVYTEIT